MILCHCFFFFFFLDVETLILHIYLKFLLHTLSIIFGRSFQIQNTDIDNWITENTIETSRSRSLSVTCLLQFKKIGDVVQPYCIRHWTYQLQWAIWSWIASYIFREMFHFVILHYSNMLNRTQRTVDTFWIKFYTNIDRLHCNSNCDSMRVSSKCTKPCTFFSSEIVNYTTRNKCYDGNGWPMTIEFLFFFYLNLIYAHSYTLISIDNDSYKDYILLSFKDFFQMESKSQNAIFFFFDF